MYIDLAMFVVGVYLGAGAPFRGFLTGKVMIIVYPIAFMLLINNVNKGLYSNGEELAEQVLNQPATPHPVFFFLGLAIGALAMFGPRVVLKLNSGDWLLSGEQGWQYFRSLLSFLSPEVRSRRTHNSNPTRALYYKTVLQFGALLAAVDGKADRREYATLKAIFDINLNEFPDAPHIYNAQLLKPSRPIEILQPFIAGFGKANALYETFIFGMCRVAYADGSVHHGELRLIQLAARMFGLDDVDTRRLLNAARRHFEGKTHKETGRTQTAPKPASLQTQHLVTLGLTAPVTKDEIKKAFRRLARKFHPDVLVSQNLPDEEMEKAESMMVEINEAYDWLKENA